MSGWFDLKSSFSYIPHPRKSVWPLLGDLTKADSFASLSWRGKVGLGVGLHWVVQGSRLQMNLKRIVYSFRSFNYRSWNCSL